MPCLMCGVCLVCEFVCHVMAPGGDPSDGEFVCS